MNEFERAESRMPYPDVDLDALHRRIRCAVAQREARPAPWRRTLTLAASAAAAALLAAGIFLSVRHHRPTADGAADFDALLASAPAEVVADAAATNYDEILYNQQL